MNFHEYIVNLKGFKGIKHFIVEIIIIKQKCKLMVKQVKPIEVIEQHHRMIHIVYLRIHSFTYVLRPRLNSIYLNS